MWHGNYGYGFGMTGFGPMGFGLGIVFVLAIVWSIIWKGLALWKSARAGSKIWFVVFLVVNTLGILEILYLFVFSKKASAVHAEHHSHSSSA